MHNLAQTCATSDAQQMGQAVKDQLQALENMVNDQGLAMRQQVERWDQIKEREEKRDSQMTAIFHTLTAVWKRRPPS